jgi:hypothetical protein
MNLALNIFLASPAGDRCAHSRLEAAPTLLLAGSKERRPAAIFGLFRLKSRRFDAGKEFMGQQ